MTPMPDEIDPITAAASAMVRRKTPKKTAAVLANLEQARTPEALARHREAQQARRAREKRERDEQAS